MLVKLHALDCHACVRANSFAVRARDVQDPERAPIMRILPFLTVFGSFVALLLAQPRQCDMPPAEVQRSFAGSPFGPESNHSMIYRPLGRSGLRVSAVSYGAWLTYLFVFL